jgi:WD40 repeat protein
VWDVGTGCELHAPQEFRDMDIDIFLEGALRSILAFALGVLVGGALIEGGLVIPSGFIDKIGSIATFGIVGLLGYILIKKALRSSMLALTADGRLAISASRGYLKMWDVATSHKLRIFAGYFIPNFINLDIDKHFWVDDVALSSDGQLIVFAAGGVPIKVWDVPAARTLGTLPGRTDWMSKVALSADGRRAVIVSGKTLRVWDTKTRCELHTLTEHVHKINDVALSVDGQLGVSVSDETFKVWDVAKGRCIAKLLVGVSLNCCAMSADGKTIVAGDSGGGVHFLELIGADELLAKDVKIEKSWLALKKEAD